LANGNVDFLTEVGFLDWWFSCTGGPEEFRIYKLYIYI